MIRGNGCFTIKTFVNSGLHTFYYFFSLLNCNGGYPFLCSAMGGVIYYPLPCVYAFWSLLKGGLMRRISRYVVVRFFFAVE